MYVVDPIKTGLILAHHFRTIESRDCDVILEIDKEKWAKRKGKENWAKSTGHPSFPSTITTCIYIMILQKIFFL